MILVPRSTQVCDRFKLSGLPQVFKRIFAICWLSYGGYYLYCKNFQLYCKNFQTSTTDLASAHTFNSVADPGGPFLHDRLAPNLGAQLVVATGLRRWAPPPATEEFQALVDLGMDSLQAFRAGTRIDAKLLGVDGFTGSPEPGKMAISS